MLRAHPFSRSSFWMKAVVAVLLVGLADVLFLFHAAGATIGAFALAWIAGVLAVRPGLLRERRGLALAVAATAFALVMIERPGLLAWGLFGLSLTMAVLSARVRDGDPAWRWMQRLAAHGVMAIAGPLIDLVRLLRAGRRRPARVSPGAVIRILALPVAGGLVFLALFARANPLIAGVLDSARLPAPSALGLLRVLCWAVILVAVGATLRPRWRRRLFDLPSLGRRRLPGVSPASVLLSLIVFNLLFGVQNALDLAFLWSGAPLPGDMGLADYAHRGAYPLIATALLAGVFVLVALRPGTETAENGLVRGLVIVWVGQNLLLVASCLLRMADYIEAYALTRFRIAVLAWMILVGIGLLLICWRMLRGKDGHWLIGANLRAALAVLVLLSVVDLGAVAAWWNVRHAREVGGPGVALDLGYLRGLGAPALVSLVELERSASNAAFRDRVAAVRAEILAETRRNQADWRRWTWRDARRLERVVHLTRERGLIRPAPGLRAWDGRLLPPPPPSLVPDPASPAEAPLTYPRGD